MNYVVQLLLLIFPLKDAGCKGFAKNFKIIFGLILRFGTSNFHSAQGDPLLSAYKYCYFFPSYPVKVIEGGTEFIHLFLANSFGIPSQNLVLHFIDSSSNCCEELLPTHSDVLEGGKNKDNLFPVILSWRAGFDA